MGNAVKAVNSYEFIQRFPWPEECRALGEPLDFLWQYDFRMSPGELWPHIADTSRLNREIGLGRRTHREIDGVLYAAESLFGLPQEWIEEPWEWVAGDYFYIRRRFVRGCARYFRAVNQIVERPDGNGLTLYVYSGWIPKNLLWRMVLRAGIPSFRRKIGRALTKFSHAAEGPCTTASEVTSPAPPMSPQARVRLQELKQALLERDLPRAATEQLITHIEKGDELDLHRIRIVVLARDWNIAVDDLLRVCLHATRLGLLELTWDLICPHCRGVREEYSSLSQMRPQGYCAICKISFDTSAPDAFEITFRIHPSIREVPPMLYCSAEPARKPHIAAQKTVPGRTNLEFRAQLSEGWHRLRAIGLEPAVTLEVAAAGAAAVQWDTTDSSSKRVAQRLAIKLENPHEAERCFVLEQLWWHNDALKPASILALQEFHDLFAEEYLAVDVKLDLGQQTILFTDIVGSTRFYRARGDAKAFVEVRTHFRKIEERIKRHGGALVKTIGDAVMGAFATPELALDAAIAIQREFPPTTGSDAIRVRASIHTGPVIAVNLNTGIDYFGNTVNFAAKLQARAGAGEIAVSACFSDHVARYCRNDRRLFAREESFTAPGADRSETIYVVAVMA